MSERTQVYEEKMKKTVETYATELGTIRAGRANPRVLDRITVDYFGTETPLNQVGNVTVPEARLLQIQPWDTSMLKKIEKAVQTSDLGINPTNDGSVIRLAFPQLTEERRRDLTKTVFKYAEEAKVAVRNIRRDALEKAKEQKKKSEITEDDLKIVEKDMQNLVDKACKDIDDLAKKKEKELMEV